MKSTVVFAKLVRWPNLVFILLTQALFYFCVINRLLPDYMSVTHLTFITISYVLIAAAGYIINDYFDLRIDLINKPERVFITNGISKYWAIGWYALLNIVAIGLSTFVDMDAAGKTIVGSTVTCIVLLFFYSAIFKKKFLIGNIVVAGVTAWSIIVLTCMQAGWSWLHDDGNNTQMIGWLAILYTGFAFIISLIREIIKDMEDVVGDEKFRCRTMPIVWGITGARLFVITLLGVLVLVLFATTVVLLREQRWLMGLYCGGMIITPLVAVAVKLGKAATTSDYHRLSTYIKLVMLSGIASMLFFIV
ncbi:geranylgeranylglycerol-phosphate geranylgeranyltransferase [Chitinophaga sp. MM2321]|uniref:geranylgeranylglycerol-phosphate geranylgeranyltransferase n=1 Tax=Chitinophaga sp. MM2321 TaxID=3137178 RepID=UPI0032D58EC6